MAEDLSLVTAPTGASNSWIVEPAGDETVDADNLSYVLNAAADVYAGTRRKADVLLESGSFYVQDMVAVAGFRGRVHGRGKRKTRIVAGAVGGDPMNLLSAADAVTMCRPTVPHMLSFYCTPEDPSYSLVMEDLTLMTNPSLATSTDKYFFEQWDNRNCLGLLQTRSIVGDYRVYNLTAVAGTAPVMQATIRALGFQASDKGKYLIIEGAANPLNNGKFLITRVISTTVVEYLNPYGVANASENCLAGFRPVRLPIPNRDVIVRRCHVQAALGGADAGNVHTVYGIPISSIDIGLYLKDEDQDAVLGDATTGPSVADYWANDVWGSDTYWKSASARPTNGLTLVEDCTFRDCGAAVHLGGNINPIPGSRVYDPPAKPVHARSIFRRNQALNCGYDQVFGSATTVLADLLTGDLIVDDNKTLNETLVNADFSGFIFSLPLPALLVGQSELGVLSSSWMYNKAMSTPGHLSFSRNQIQQVDGESNHMILRGVQDYITFQVDHNTCIGDSTGGIYITEAISMDGTGTASYNKTEGAGESGDVTLDITTDITATGNTEEADLNLSVTLHMPDGSVV